jgi:signal transduction histidine kinase
MGETAPSGEDPAAWMGQEARRIGHDLNNCLGVVGGRAELLRMHLDRGNVESARKGVDVILGQMDRMKALSDELRDLHRKV